MENKPKTYVLFIAILLFMVAAEYPQFLGIAIFVTVLLVASAKYLEGPKKPALPKQASVDTVQPAYVPPKDSHVGQLLYSKQYSQKKTESHDTIKDAPLSEAERNVLYGK